MRRFWSSNSAGPLFEKKQKKKKKKKKTLPNPSREREGLRRGVRP
jgi:hypothetical protein